MIAWIDWQLCNTKIELQMRLLEADCFSFRSLGLEIIFIILQVLWILSRALLITFYDDPEGAIDELNERRADAM